MMSAIILQVLKTSMFTSPLIGLLLLMIPLLQKWYRAKWRYIVWLVIAVRLMVPINLSLPQAPINIELPEQAATVINPAANAPLQEENRPESYMNDTAINEIAPISRDVPKASISPMQITGFIWLSGMAVFLLFQVCAYQLFLRKLKNSQKEKAPAYIREMIWEIGVDMGICKLPEPVITDVIDAPVLIGVIRPRILLPHTKYGDEELAFILRHELVHYRRRDMWYKLVLLLANALHWFNPLIYLMTVQAAKDIELACDDDVIRGLDRDARARYGDTILSALPGKRRLEPVFSTHFGSSKKNIRTRLRNLFDTAVKRRGIVAMCAVIACALMITSFVTIGYAATKPDSLSTANTENSQTNLSIQRLGQHSFKSGDTLKTDIRWRGKSTVMLLYTERDYTNDEILVPLQGIPGLPKPNYNNINHEKQQGGVFNFTSSPTSPLAQEQKVSESGSYHIYIVRYGFDSISPLTGNVTINKSDGYSSIVWQSGTTTNANTMNTVIVGSTTYHLIDTEQQLRAIGKNTDSLSLNYLLNRDITLTGEWVSIGDFDNPFTGTFNGNGYEIKGLKMTDSAAKFIGLFGYAKDATIYNVTLRDLDVERAGGTGKHVGAICAIAQSCDIYDNQVITSENNAVSVSQPDTSVKIATLTGSNNITVKSIGVGEVTCIGKIELGPDSAYTATLSVESGSGEIIALHDSPNATKLDGTFWSNYYGNGTGSNIYFSSEQPKTAYVYLGSIGTKLTNVKVNLVQTKSPVSPDGNPYFQIKSNGKSILHSGSFVAKAGQTLTITATSSIKGGTVDLFMFSPSNKEQRFTFSGSNATRTIQLSAGTWAYNCTGFFDSGDIVITGTVVSGVRGKSAAADKAAYEVMQYSRSWAMVEYMLPYMTREGIDAAVKLNNELNPSNKKTASDYYGLTTPSKTESDQRSYALMEKSGNWSYSSPLFPYMTNEGIGKVVTLYNQKTGKNVKAADYYN